jgi:P4 family phage/plasmid primase-like protien
MSNLKHDKKAILEALSILCPSGVVELRALDTEPGSGYDRTVSGYFDHHHHEALADAALRLAGGAAGVYITLQEIKEDLLGRACNRARPIKKKDPTTSDPDVTAYRWLPLDFDADKPKGVSSNEAEHALAHDAARVCMDALHAEGWPDPVYADSGNGAHVLYRLPAGWATGADGEKIKAVLAALIKRFSVAGVDLDAKVFNPARIWKLPGTVARKGDPIPSRPHRMSKIISAPEVVEVVRAELLDVLVVEGQAILNPPKPQRPVLAPGESRLPIVAGMVGAADAASAPTKKAVSKPQQQAHEDTDEKVESALACIPADDRDVWLNVGAALHEWGSPRARVLWDGWSMQSEKFEMKEQDKAWNSFREGGRNGKARTIATVYRLAQENGWEHPAARAKRERQESSGSNVVHLRQPAPASKPAAAAKPPAAAPSPSPAPPAASPPKRWSGVLPPPSDACFFHQPNDLDLALQFMADVEAGVGQELVFDEGALWHYTPSNKIWRQVKQSDLTRHVTVWHRSFVYNAKGEIKQTSTGEDMTAEINAAKCRGAYWMASQNRTVERFFEDSKTGVVTADGTFLTADFRRGEIDFEPAGPDTRARAALPCNYVEDAKGALLQNYLSTVHEGLPDAEDRVRLMGEIAFVALTGLGPKLNKAILCYGTQGTGKSVFLEILSGLVPYDAQCAIQPHEIAHEYYGAELVGMLLNVVTECNEAEVMTEAGFKAVISGETITRRHIRGDPVKFRPRALHVFAGNKLPPAPGASDAFWVRWIPIGFERKFRETDREIKDLGARIVAEELDAVLAWAVECGRELLKRRKYTMPGSAEKLFKRWKTDSDSVAAWLDDECAILPDTTERRLFWRAGDAYKTYKKWCEDNGYRAFNSCNFKNRLETAGVICTKVGINLYGISPLGDRVDTSPDGLPDEGAWASPRKPSYAKPAR